MQEPPTTHQKVPHHMSTPPSVDLILDHARRIDTGKIRRLAQGVRTAALALDTEICTYNDTDRLGRLRAEIQHLETRLGVGSNPGGRVAGGVDRAASVDYDPAIVRTWAKANGWDAPTKGRYLPLDLLTAWREATA